jgi:hypothetical protein
MYASLYRIDNSRPSHRTMGKRDDNAVDTTARTVGDHSDIGPSGCDPQS